MKKNDQELNRLIQGKIVDRDVRRLKELMQCEFTEATQQIRTINKVISNGTGALVYQAIFGQRE